MPEDEQVIEKVSAFPREPLVGLGHGGHGTHTSTTAGGNARSTAIVGGVAIGDQVAMVVQVVFWFSLAAGVLVHRGYCRYLCPLGAGMGLLGRLRRLDWIARRTECGQPCQRCRSDCAYQAIKKPGAVDYNECFQCLDCVAIYNNEQLCVPLIMKNRQLSRQVHIPIMVVHDAPEQLQQGEAR